MTRSGIARHWPLALPVLALAALAASGDAGPMPDFARRLMPPSLEAPFGTDALGRDLFGRSLAGLSLSLRIGLAASLASTAIALGLTMAASLHRMAGGLVSFVTDAVLSLPHLVLLVLIAFAMGGGAQAVVVAVALSHWPRLTRLLRLELEQVLSSDFVAASRAFGRSRLHVATRHVLPHLLPQLAVGAVLMLPHAILHEAALTFLGFGLEPTRPALGILMSEAMRTLSAGYWWLGLFPGLVLVAAVLVVERVGAHLQRHLTPMPEAAR